MRYGPGWVTVISPHRSERPKVFGERKGCPFCPGNEVMTPPASAVALKGGKGEVIIRDGDSNCWAVRVFPNAFPVFGVGECRGYHEVVVECDRHVTDYSEMSDDEVYIALKTALYRMKKIKENDPRIKFIGLIKNVGKDAGASIEHVHSQLVATEIVPPIIMNEQKLFESGKCWVCEVLDNQSLMIHRGKHVALAANPYGRHPYEVIIAPTEHAKDFLDLSEEAIKEVASLLKRVSEIFTNQLKIGSYNMWLHNSPKDAADFHWHIVVSPLSSRWGGIEKGYGMYVVTVSPEAAAEVFKQYVLKGSLTS